jgi:hypothetical protein
MTLYSADVLDIAKPVPKKGKGKKNVEKTVEPVKEIVPEPEVVEVAPPKKQPTEKQLAALAKAQESRKRKREEAEKAKQELLDVEKQKEEKKKEASEKRKAKKMQKLATPPPSLDEEIDRAVEELNVKPTITKRDDNEPPLWFKQYVSGVKKEEAKISREKKPKKQIQQEAVEVAQKNWNDAFTRDRVRNEVDSHMSRMYQMMFAGRRMK